ncbi:MAG: site-2 protease family protein [Chloroflexota bacterium]|nr:site-2 protease family protein [Chloroflexota bacterium]MDH5243393.1 site-2 protease family protein [Chloroflexota bacterium]
MNLETLLPVAIAVAIMLLVGFPVHEFSHALAAYRLGDGTAKLFGRLTLNPIAHFDPLGGILLALTFLGSGGNFGFGWAKPTPVNTANLEGGHRGEALVAAAGPISNLVMAAMVALPLRYLIATPELAAQIPDIVLRTMVIFIQINLILMIFNLFPIPPLDGSKVLFAFMPPRLAWQWRPILEQYGFIILLVVFFLPPGGSIGVRILGPILDGLFSLLVGV